MAATLPHCLLLPGYTDAGPGHWMSLWHREQPEWKRVEQRDWERPGKDEWVAALDAAVAAAPAPVCLIAHSLGCTTVAHWVAERGGANVAAAFLVAPADADRPGFPPEMMGFAPVPEIALPFSTMVVASSTDPYLTLSRARTLAHAWGSELVEIGDAGHICTDSGHGRWLEGRRLLDRLLSRGEFA